MEGLVVEIAELRVMLGMLVRVKTLVLAIHGVILILVHLVKVIREEVLVIKLVLVHGFVHRMIPRLVHRLDLLEVHALVHIAHLVAHLLLI